MNKSARLISLLISIGIYFVILVGAYFLKFHQIISVDEKEVIVEFKEYEKRAVEDKILPKIKKTSKPTIISKLKIELPKVEEEIVDNEAVISQIIIDSNYVVVNDSLEKKINWLDSLVISDPNLQILKYAVSEHVKNNPTLQTDSAKVVAGIKTIMQDYYSNQYPTPVYKFGDGAPGIRIGDIIDIFKSNDVDEEKIKKYLKIGKYDK